MPNWVFWLVTISVTLLGIGLISLATAFDFYGHQVTRELTRAFGEAFVVAAFIASTVDQYIKHGLVSDLYKYIAGYGLPSDIQDKIEELTKTTIIRRDFAQNYLLEHHSTGRLKLTVDGTYKIVNCSNHVKEHTPRLDFRSAFSFAQEKESPARKKEHFVFSVFSLFPHRRPEGQRYSFFHPSNDRRSRLRGSSRRHFV